MQCSSVVLLCSSLEPLRNTLRPHTESNETIDKWVCSGYFTPDTGTRERENTRREHRNTTRRMTSAWCNLVVPCWKLIGCIRDSPLASKHSVFLPGTLQTASFLLVPGTLRRTPLYLEARVFTPSCKHAAHGVSTWSGGSVGWRGRCKGSNLGGGTLVRRPNAPKMAPRTRRSGATIAGGRTGRHFGW